MFNIKVFSTEWLITHEPAFIVLSYPPVCGVLCFSMWLFLCVPLIDHLNKWLVVSVTDNCGQIH